MDEKKWDLYNNPMVDMAKKSMTAEQIEEYKKIGKYMYSSAEYENLECGTKVSKDTQDVALYAYNSVKSGLDPKELSDLEISALGKIYGKKWYEDFDYKIEDIPNLFIEVLTENPQMLENSEQIQTHIKNLNMCRQQRRAIQRKMDKVNKQKERIKKETEKRK